MEDFDAAHGIRSVRLRYFNAAGADPAAEIGEWHEPETHLIPLVLDAALGRRPAISIFGTDYPTPDGTALRDYIHVMDLAEAHVAALTHLLAGGDFSRRQSRHRHWRIRPRSDPHRRERDRHEKSRRARSRARTGDPPALVADPRRAGALLGWRARADLAAMVEDAWRWHLKLHAVAR